MKEEREASIWAERIYRNRFRCDICGRLLLNERKGITTENLILFTVRGQTQGMCQCGNPAVVFRKHTGEQVSENYEDQIKAEANDEIAHLLYQCDLLTRKTGEMTARIKTLEESEKSLKERLNELQAVITEYGIKNGNLRFKLDRKDEECRQLKRKIETLERKEK